MQKKPRKKPPEEKNVKRIPTEGEREDRKERYMEEKQRTPEGYGEKTRTKPI